MNAGRDGFSLVEVVVAVGVFVAGVVAAVALLAQTTGSASERLERGAAERVVASTQALLETVSWEQVLARMDDEERWFANRDGTRIDLVEPVSAETRFFEITLERDATRFPAGQEARAAQAEFWIVCTWPTQDVTGGRIAENNQTQVRSRWVVLR